MKIVKNSLVAFALICFAAIPMSATTDEALFGTYAYADQSFSIRFDWQLDSLEGLTVGVKSYQKRIELTPNGLSGAFYTYDAQLPHGSDSKTTCLLHLEALINSDDKPLFVAGTYVELVPDKSGSQRVKFSKIFVLHRVRRAG